MKRKIFKFVGLLFAILYGINIHAQVNAYYFEADGIYYYNAGDNAVVVVAKDNNPYGNSYSGDVVIPAEVTYEGQTYVVVEIAPCAFQSCKDLTSIKMPVSPDFKYISDYAFVECEKLTEVDIPEGVWLIGPGAFGGCTSLKTVTLPSTLERLTVLPIFDGIVLENVICKAMTPPDGSLIFGYEDSYDFTLTVPCGTIDAYRNSEGWKVVNNIIEDCSKIEDIAVSSTTIYPNPAKEIITLDLGHCTSDGADAVVIFNNNGQIVYKSDIKSQNSISMFPILRREFTTSR